MKGKLFIIIMVCTTITELYGQEQINWKTLSDVTFTDEYFPEEDTYFLTPTFGESLHSLNGKQISITGYFLNIDPSSGLYLVSKNPMASCFFCGMAGPETIMEVRFINKVNFKTDDIVSVQGKFTLNGDDINYCNYILENATGKLKK